MMTGKKVLRIDDSADMDIVVSSLGVETQTGLRIWGTGSGKHVYGIWRLGRRACSQDNTVVCGVMV
jgi:hypothetical protein